MEDNKIGDQDPKSAKKQDNYDHMEEEKMLMEEEKKRSEEVRINKAKNLDIDFDKEFQQMISVLLKIYFLLRLIYCRKV